MPWRKGGENQFSVTVVPGKAGQLFNLKKNQRHLYVLGSFKGDPREIGLKRDKGTEEEV